jgi:hypothetical protein
MLALVLFRLDDVSHADDETIAAARSDARHGIDTPLAVALVSL